MKRIISFLLALILVLPCLPGVARAEIVGECGDNLLWCYSDGVLTVSGTGPMFSYAYEDAPWCLGAMDVQKVILEEGVTEVGDFAFRDCGNLTSVALPSTLRVIGQGSFAYCDSLRKVSISDLTAWMQVDFACWYEESYDEASGAWREDEVCSNPLSCNETVILYVDGEKASTVTLPEGLTSIGSNSFRNYRNLTALYLPASVKTIGDYAFEGCTGLKDVHYSGTPTQVASIRYGQGNTLLIRATWHFDEGPHVHSFGHWETASEPSCTAPGLEHRYCSSCDHFESREIPETDHAFGSWSTVKASSTAAEGQQRRDCTACDAWETRPIPMTPTVSISGDAASGKPKLSWKAVTGADKYRIYRSTSKSGTYTYLATTSAKTYTDTSANAGTNYYYKVRALDVENDLYSGYSPVVNRVCDLPRPSVTISVNSATGKNVVKWETVEGANRYYVYRSTQKSSGFEKIYTGVKARSYEDASAVAGTTYYYKIRALNVENQTYSAYSPVVNRVCDLPRPSVTISVNSATGKNVVKWETVEGANRYYVYRSTQKSSGFEKIYTGVKARSYEDASAVAGTTYYYKIRALNVENQAYSAYSPVVNRVCDLPRPSVTISVNSATGKNVVKWETVEGAAKYYVYRSTQKSSGFEKIYTAVKARSYEDASAVAGTTYYYKVIAAHENASANSAYSAVLSQVCDLARPTVTVSCNSNGKPYLKWSTVKSAKCYQIYRSKSSSGTYTSIGTTTSLTYTDKTAKAGTKYYYKIRAIHANSNANSAYSSPKSITAK